MTFSVLIIPTLGCFLKVLSAPLRYLTGKVHFTRIIVVHLLLLNQSLKRTEASTESCGRGNQGGRGGREGRAIKMKQGGRSGNERLYEKHWKKAQSGPGLGEAQHGGALIV